MLGLPQATMSLEEIILSKDLDEAGKCERIEKIQKDHPEQLHQKFDNDKSALHLAVSQNLKQVVKLLLSLGLSPNETDKNQKTPMHFAAILDDATILELLCADPRANLWARDRRENTIFHLAAREGKGQCLAVLSQYAFDISATHKRGMTVESYIGKLENKEIRKQLQSALEKLSCPPIFSKYQWVAQDVESGSLAQPKSLFMVKAQDFDDSIKTAIHQGPFRYKNNLASILLLCESIEEKNLKEIISIIHQYCLKLKFDNQMVIKTVYGLFDYFSAEEIFKSICLISEHLESDQIIISHYFVKNILQTCYERNVPISDELNRLFLAYYDGIRSLQKEHKIVSLEPLNELKKILLEQKKIDIPSAVSMTEMSRHSWVEEIQTLLDSEKKIQIEQVRNIAMEMRALTLAFYQYPISKEFSGHYCSDEVKKSALSPMISEHKKQSDQLSKLISHIILTQLSREKRARAIKLFINVLTYSMEVHDGVGPDLDSVQNVFGALNCSPITRLSKSCDLVPAKHKRILKEFEVLVDSDKNNKAMRDCQRAHALSLPYFGLMYKDYTFNRESVKRANLLNMGEIHQYLHYLNEHLAGKFIEAKTDLAQELRKSSLHENILFQRSLELEPVIPNLSRHSLSKIRNDIAYIQNNNLKLSVKVDNRCFEGKEALNQIAKWLKKQQESKEIDNETVEKIMRDCINYVSPSQSRYVDLAAYLEQLTFSEAPADGKPERAPGEEYDDGTQQRRTLTFTSPRTWKKMGSSLRRSARSMERLSSAADSISSADIADIAEKVKEKKSKKDKPQ